jgi:hypothetical protein
MIVQKFWELHPPGSKQACSDLYSNNYTFIITFSNLTHFDYIEAKVMRNVVMWGELM